MKLALFTTLLFILMSGVGANAQIAVKLFDPAPISVTDPNTSGIAAFRTADIYLNCPMNGGYATLSGPNGGLLVVDNYIAVNGQNVCPNGDCFNGAFLQPMDLLGFPVENAYNAIVPVDISGHLNGSGVYRFELMDYGWTKGSSAVYLNTNCSLEASTQVCHRNSGNRGYKTLTVGQSAVAAHVAHGDTVGPCAGGN